MTDSPSALGLRAWADQLGPDALAVVLAAVNLSPVYFNAMALHNKSCTPAMFERIEAACKRLGVDVLPDYELCTRKSVQKGALAARLAGRTADRHYEQRVVKARVKARMRYAQVTESAPEA